VQAVLLNQLPSVYPEREKSLKTKRKMAAGKQVAGGEEKGNERRFESDIYYADYTDLQHYECRAFNGENYYSARIISRPPCSSGCREGV